MLGLKKMFAKRDKHYPSRSGQTSLATAVTNITKPVTKINFGPSTLMYGIFITAILLLSLLQGKGYLLLI